MELARNDFGDLFKTYPLSKSATPDLDDVHVHSNHCADRLVYHLVYGAVPKEYETAAAHFLKYITEQSVVRKTAKTKTVRLNDGELECMTYAYWQFSMQDLLTWRDDLPRRPLKLILVMCWVNLRDEIVRHSDSKRDVKNAQAALVRIRSYANFDDSTHLTKTTMYMVRSHLHLFCDLITEEYRLFWEYLLRCAGVHHYLCHHTKVMVQGWIKVIQAHLQAQFGEATAQDGGFEKSLLYACLAEEPKNASDEKTIVNFSLVQSLFREYITKPGKVTRGLRVKLDNLIYGMCRSCAAHFVRVGIMDYDTLDEHQMVGFHQH